MISVTSPFLTQSLFSPKDHTTNYRQVIGLNILALETSSRNSQVVVQCGDKTVGRCEESPSHSKIILEMIDSALLESGLGFADLNGLAVTRGPGSFTGLRIGIAVAQAIAYAHRLPVTGVSSLAALAFAARAQLPATVNRVLAMLDARMGQIYCGWYAYKEGFPELDVEMAEAETVISPAVLQLPAKTLTAGSFASVGSGLLYHEELPAWVTDEVSLLTAMPTAAAVAVLGKRQLESGQGATAEALQPVYLRDKVTS